MKYLKKIANIIKKFFKGIIHKLKTNIPFAISLSIFVVSAVVFFSLLINDSIQAKKMNSANSGFLDAIQNAELSKTPTAPAEGTPTVLPGSPTPENSKDPTPDTTKGPAPEVTNGAAQGPTDTVAPTPTNTPSPMPTKTPTPTPSPVMTAGGQAAYEKNNDYVGWLEILGKYNGGLSEKNRVNHPVFQTFDDPATPFEPANEETNEGWYYLYRDAKGEKNKFGSLFVDERCSIGTGSAENNYENGIAPSSNIIIYGHNVINYLMFGALKQYWKDKSFYKAHNKFSFTTCYEYREYEIISYYEDVIPQDDTFYFGSFVNCHSEQEFDKWYKFITEKSYRKTGVTAEYGDEFVTLVTCATADSSPRRTVVVGKRIK